jgi:lysophospholipase L1-like esterase
MTPRARAPLERIRRCYVGTALVFFNTFLLVLIVASLLAVGLEISYRLFGRHKYSTYLDLDSYAEIPRATAMAVGLEFDDYGDQQSFVFNPWTTFMVAPRRGRLFNVDPGRTVNARRTADVVQQNAGHPKLTVWCFGGSTLFGWGLPDSHTIPSLLQERLQRHLPDRQVRVVNFGQPYWFSSSQLALFVALLRNEAKPTVAIFLDGVNDTVLPLEGVEEPAFAYRAELGWNRERRIERGEAPWLEVTPTFPPFAIVKHLSNRGYLRKRDEKAAYRRASPDPVVRAVEIYRRNRGMIAAVGQQAGVPAYFFLQPARFFPSQDRTLPIDHASSLQRVYRILADEAASKTLPRVFTLHAALDGLSKPYVDGAHYSDSSSRALADQIGRLLVDALR